MFWFALQALVVDAKAYGNVARFMNHSCAGNLNKHVRTTASGTAFKKLFLLIVAFYQSTYQTLYDYIDALTISLVMILDI